VQCGNRIERQHGIQPAVTDLDIGQAALVKPRQSPPSILALKWQQRSEVTLHAYTDRRSSEYPHGKRKCIPRTACALEHSLAQELRESRVQRIVAHFLQEASGEEQKAFCRLVAPRSIQVSSVLEYAENPLERLGQLVPTPSRVKKGEDVEADDGVGAWPFSVKERLPKVV
jgi:hypothetical protein